MKKVFIVLAIIALVLCLLASIPMLRAGWYVATHKEEIQRSVEESKGRTVIPRDTNE